jgi:nitroreductase
MQTDLPASRDVPTITDGLADAVAAAVHAPSIHDTRPWRWLLASDTVDLYLDRGRVLSGTDPDARLATMSCGAALHHARTVLAAQNWRVTVSRMPDAADQEHLARLRVYAAAPADPTAVQHARTMPARRTDRRPVTGAPVNAEDLRTLAATVQAEGAWLHHLRPEQVTELRAAAEHAQDDEAGESEWRTELGYWTMGWAPAARGGDRTDAPISAENDRAARFAILHGRSDEPRDWLRAGEALSAAWLTATERGISVLPMSAPVEIRGTREAMRRILSYLSHPFLVLRLGTTATSAGGSE